jgi:hypothetical protein
LRGNWQIISNKNGLFAGGLTKCGNCDLLLSLQPKSSFLPEAGRGRPKHPKRFGRGERNQATGFKATFKAKPDS